MYNLVDAIQMASFVLVVFNCLWTKLAIDEPFVLFSIWPTDFFKTINLNNFPSFFIASSLTCNANFSDEVTNKECHIHLFKQKNNFFWIGIAN